MIRYVRGLLALTLSFFLLAACASPQRVGGPDALSAQQRRADAHLQLALAYYQQAQWQVALDEAELALQASPRQPEGLSMRGLIHMAAGRRELAGLDFLEALRIAPDQPDYLNNYAWYLCQDGRARASLPWFERAAASPAYRSPETALDNAGTCSLAAGDRAAAEAYFLRAVELAPANARGHAGLAGIYLDDGDYARARFHAEQATAVARPGADVLWLAIKVARKSDQPSTETKLLAQLRRLYPDSAEYAAYQRGVIDE